MGNAAAKRYQMDEQLNEQNEEPVQVKKDHEPLPAVLTVRNAKEYLGESLLIIFSVVLALLLTELLNNLHEKSREKEILKQLREELVNNKKQEAIQYAYQLQVLKNIDSALSHPAYAKQFIDSGVLNLKVIAPDGVRRVDLDNVAWELAKQNNTLAKLALGTYSMLTNIYDQQQHIAKAEEEIAKILLSWESRKPENIRTTLLLISDNYHGWAVDRAPVLLAKYQQAIDKLSHE